MYKAVKLLPQQSEISQLHKSSMMTKSKCKCWLTAKRQEVVDVMK